MLRITWGNVLSDKLGDWKITSKFPNSGEAKNWTPEIEDGCVTPDITMPPLISERMKYRLVNLTTLIRNKKWGQKFFSARVMLGHAINISHMSQAGFKPGTPVMRDR